MEQKTYVWDPFIRLFHWSLVLSFVVAYISGEDESLVHVYAGYIILGLVAARVIWGFIGTRHARFSDFLRSPRQAFVYLKGLVLGDAKSYLGHNPAAGWMTVALLLSLLLTGLSGLQVYGLEGRGPMARQAASAKNVGNDSVNVALSQELEKEADDEHETEGGESEENEEFWEEIHEALANFTVFLIVFHILGVVLSSAFHKQNLVKSMITGYKTQG